jgi:hypothetical protein
MLNNGYWTRSWCFTSSSADIKNEWSFSSISCVLMVWCLTKERGFIFYLWENGKSVGWLPMLQTTVQVTQRCHSVLHHLWPCSKNVWLVIWIMNWCSIFLCRNMSLYFLWCFCPSVLCNTQESPSIFGASELHTFLLCDIFPNLLFTFWSQPSSSAFSF